MTDKKGDRMIEKLKRAEEHATAGTRYTVLKLCGSGVEVEMWCTGKRWGRVVTWDAIQHADGNPIISAINEGDSVFDAARDRRAARRWRSAE